MHDAIVLQPSAETRAFFHRCIAKHCAEGEGLAENVPHEAFVKAVNEIGSVETAQQFLSGHLHWLQGRRPRTLEDALAAARANVAWCFEELKSEQVEMWTSLLDIKPAQQTKSPEEAFQTAKAVGEKIKAGKDPAQLSSLAKKLLQKKGATR